MPSAIENWTCPNCMSKNSTPLLNEKVCECCGYSDEEPEEDTYRGYY